MANSLSIGIVIPSNYAGGPQKVSAIAAYDLAKAGHQVTIFIPSMPYYYYAVSLRRRPLHWLASTLPYLRDRMSSGKFVFDDILKSECLLKWINVKFVLRRIPDKDLKSLDCLIIHTIAQVSEYSGKFPQNRQIYLLHHPEEHQHQNESLFKGIRKSFEGTTIVISPFTRRAVASHLVEPPLVPNPISPQIWHRRNNIDTQSPRRDILFFWKSYDSSIQGSEIIRHLIRIRPRTTVTVWIRDRQAKPIIHDLLPEADLVENLDEEQLGKIYRQHSLLLFCSQYEGFGMPPIEGMASGCIPVLYPNVGAAELYAKHQINCIHLNGCTINTAEDLAVLLNNSSLIKTMRRNAVNAITAFNPNGYGIRLLKAADMLENKINDHIS